MLFIQGPPWIPASELNRLPCLNVVYTRAPRDTNLWTEQATLFKFSLYFSSRILHHFKLAAVWLLLAFISISTIWLVNNRFFFQLSIIIIKCMSLMQSMGITFVSKSHLILVLFVTGWQSGASYLKSII